MSTDYRAYAVIGCKVKPQQLFTTKKVTCGCPSSDNSSNFCPHCGASFKSTEQVPQPWYNEVERTVLHNGYMLQVVSDTDDKNYYVGIITIANCCIDLPINAHGRIKEILEPLGIWSEFTFGLHSVLHCSY